MRKVVVSFPFCAHVIISYFKGVSQNTSHLCAKPLFKTTIDVKHRNQKHQKGGHKTKGSKGSNELTAQRTPNYSPASFHEDLYDVSKDEEHQEKHENDVEIYKAKEKYRMNEGKLSAYSDKLKLYPGKGQKEYRYQNAYDDFAPTLFKF